MKKFLSLTLAAAMAASVASVAFAATRDGADFVVDGDNLYIRDNGALVEIEDAATTYGETIYYTITVTGAGVGTAKDQIKPGAGNVLVDSDAADHIKVSAKWQMNGDLVENVDIVPVMNNKKSQYVLAIETKEMPNETDDSDVIGTITLKAPKSGDKFNAEDKEYDLEVAFNLSNKDAKNIDANENLNKTADDNYLYKFEDDNQEEEEHEIELYGDMGRFVVNTIGQGDLVINTNVEYNKGIEGAASDVNYVYFNGNDATFNRLGDLYLNAEEGNILYRVNKDGSLTKMPTEYDDDEEAFVVRTRVLGSYVIAEEELDLAKVNAAVVEAPEAPVAPVAPSNPSTGAAC